MKKIIACTAMLSLMFIACGNESSTNARGQDSAIPNSGVTNSAIGRKDAVKTAVANTGPCSMNNANAGKKAYLTNTENAGYQIVIPDINVDNEYHNDEVQIERVGDTLRILPDGVSLNWICYAYYTFDLPASEKDINYFEFKGNVFDVIPGPAPEKAPDTL